VGPKSILALKDYSRQKFIADLIAGVTVGLVALPLAMAFAIASGVRHRQLVLRGHRRLSDLGTGRLRVQIGVPREHLLLSWPALSPNMELMACSCAPGLPVSSSFSRRRKPEKILPCVSWHHHGNAVVMPARGSGCLTVSGCAEKNEEDTGNPGAHEQAINSIFGDNAGHDNNKCSRGTANLHS